MNKLKPCKLCGGEADMEYRNGAFHVKCKNCGYKGAYVISRIFNISKAEKAIKEWNEHLGSNNYGINETINSK